ncbi:MAG: hypothetical protein RL748_4182, partial [Pseudomonadota bacterium]
QAKAVGMADTGMPAFVQIPSHIGLAKDRFILTTFKWNVHTQGRTASQKYLSEIVHDNPMWIHPETARKMKLQTGDWVELTTYRPKSGTQGDIAFRSSVQEQIVGTARVQVFVTNTIHPRVVAVSNSVGWAFGGRATEGRKGKRAQTLAAGKQTETAKAMAPPPKFDDLEYGVWWDKQSGGRGNGVNINAILPINPSPLVGMQSWYDTVCSMKKVKV